MNRSVWGRVLVALLVLILDLVVFILPLGALFIAYVLIARPRAVKEWMDRLYA